MMTVRVLFIGDVVGHPGRQMLQAHLATLVRDEAIDLGVANCATAAGGSGLTPKLYEQIVGAGVDVITLGDHVYRKKDIVSIMDDDRALVRPANLPTEAPGRAYCIVPTPSGVPVAVVVLLGRLFMKPIDCPFHAVDRVLGEIGDQARVILVDMHAEATSDKQCMGRYLDGRVSAVLGTHTHVATADETLLPGGTAYITDVGMTGPYHSILGRRIDRVLAANVTMVPHHFDVASGDERLCGVLVDVDADTGRAQDIRRLCVRGLASGSGAEKGAPHDAAPSSPEAP